MEALLFYRRNEIVTPEKSVEHWLQNAPVELKAKLAKAELLVVDEAKTCQQFWDAFLKFKAAEVKLKTLRSYKDSMARFYEVFLPTELLEAITPERLLEWKASMQDDYAKSSIVKLFFISLIVHKPTTDTLGIQCNKEFFFESQGFKNLLDSCFGTVLRA